MSYLPGMNTGHGHVWERPDGVKARCGGPGLCKICSRDEADRIRFVEEHSKPNTDGFDVLRADLTELLNRHSIENDTNTPDWVLADYLLRCLEAWRATVPQRDAFHGFDPEKTFQVKD